MRFATRLAAPLLAAVAFAVPATTPAAHAAAAPVVIYHATTGFAPNIAPVTTVPGAVVTVQDITNLAVIGSRSFSLSRTGFPTVNATKVPGTNTYALRVPTPTSAPGSTGLTNVSGTWRLTEAATPSGIDVVVV